VGAPWADENTHKHAVIPRLLFGTGIASICPPREASAPLPPGEASTVKWTASLIVAALLLSSAAVLGVARTLPDSLGAAVDAGALAVFGGGALLGLLIRRGRLALGLVVLALADRALVHFDSRAIFDAVALLLPLNLAVIAWLREASLHTARGASRLGVILLQAGAVALLQRPELASFAAVLDQPLLTAEVHTWTPLPQIALVAFAAALGLVLVRILMDGRPLAAAAGWALVASFLALDGATTARPVSVHFATAGLLLLVGASWERPRGAHVDDVTGLPATLALNKMLERLPGRYALAAVEIDEFRAFREEHGPESARRMLRLVADALGKVGGGGRAFYCGAQAFAIVFRRTSAVAAVRHVEAVRRVVEAATLDVRAPERPRAPGQPAPRASRGVERTVSVTISVGVAQPEEPGADPHEVLRAAQRALDSAKEAGQNRVTM
jgi:GGDEF domain-containing protein